MSEQNEPVTEEQANELIKQMQEGISTLDEIKATVDETKREYEEFKAKTIEQVNTITEGLNNLQAGINMWMQQVEATLHGHNIRLNVWETLATGTKHENAEIAKLCEEVNAKVKQGTAAMEDLSKIAADIVIPELQRRAEERRKQMEEEAARMAGQSTTIVGPDGQPAETNAKLVDPSGRVISMRVKDEQDDGDTTDEEATALAQQDHETDGNESV